MNEQETIRLLNKDLQSAMSDKSKMAGQFSSISTYLNDAEIPNMQPAHLRVKLLSLMYSEIKAENAKLKLICEYNASVD